MGRWAERNAFEFESRQACVLKTPTKAVNYAKANPGEVLKTAAKEAVKGGIWYEVARYLISKAEP